MSFPNYTLNNVPRLNVRLSGFVFAHRKKADKTYDSICMRCYRTAANAPSEDELTQSEKEHVLWCSKT